MCEILRYQAVSAELIPRIPIPTNAKIIHKFLECVKSKLSEKSCRATEAIIPAAQEVSMRTEWLETTPPKRK